jgi:rhodanese-related sulfurtransferase
MPTAINRDEIQGLLAGGVQLVEVLPKAEYEDEHLPGAIHLPLRRIERQARTTLDPGRPVIVYCWDSA